MYKSAEPLTTTTSLQCLGTYKVFEPQVEAKSHTKLPCHLKTTTNWIKIMNQDELREILLCFY